MAPARLSSPDDDPITASYSIYLTPANQDQIYLLQYPNQPREKPYNYKLGLCPSHVRIKPKSGHLEMDIPLNTENNFNKFQSLRWGANNTEVNGNGGVGTYGMATGFAGSGRRRPTGGGGVRDPADRENDIRNDLTMYHDANRDGKVMRTQTLGGQILKHDDSEEQGGKPIYFVGGFRGEELHLTKVTGLVQMRPQFHHLDAEDVARRAVAQHSSTSNGTGTEDASATRASVTRQSYKQSSSSNPKGELEDRERQMREALQASAEESWVGLGYYDESEDGAFTAFEERMFVKDVEGAVKLESGMRDEEYLDAVSAGVGGRRKRRKRESKDEEQDGEDG